jgi:2-oxoglutarate ferredoxin oxidoreductase subunit beta
VVNSDSPVDLVALALQLGATYVARGFSGDKAQLVPLIKGAIRHGGAAFIDVISPCVAFNNHAGSTKSYDYVREHNEAVSRIDFITRATEITLDAPGEVVDVRQHDGTLLRLRKLHEGYDPTDRIAALNFMQEHQATRRGGHRPAVRGPAGHRPAHGAEHQDATRLCPGAAALDRLNASLR